MQHRRSRFDSFVLPSLSARRSELGATVGWILIAFLLAPPVFAQPLFMFSNSFQGPSAFGGLDSGGAHAVTPGSPTHAVVYSALELGVVPGMWGLTEVDALSWGLDTPLDRNDTEEFWGSSYRIFFSTDEFASGVGITGTPSIFSEGATGSQEASADIQRTRLWPTQPASPAVTFYGHKTVYDGDGIFPFGGPTLGLVEPNPPGPGPDVGDTIDALDIWLALADGKVYFSLDGGYADPLEGGFGNLGTAGANGVMPGDVLISNGTFMHAVWANASQLGLDSNDDLDALAIWQNADGDFQPSEEPYDWTTGATDMLLFSVRRGSPVIGQLDSFFGAPIQEGDILSTPCTTGPPCFGGGRPAIFLRASSLGLDVTDDLDAMTVR